MQVSSTNSLTWLKSASGAAASGSASLADGQDPLDASGAEGASPSSLLASLQSPSQQFSAGGLSALISAQLDQGAAQSSTGSGPGGTLQSGAAPDSAASGVHQHHHRRGVDGVGHFQAQPLASSSASTAAATPATSDAGAEPAEAPTAA